MAGGRRAAAGAHPAPRDGRQLLVDGHPRTVRAVLGDLRRPRTGVRHRRWSRGQRGPLHRDLESRLHAERARRGHRQGRLRDPRAVAAQEHRHRHGRGAGGVPAAGRRQRLRDRSGATGHRPRRRHRAARVRRRQSRGRRAIPRHRRPQPDRGDHHRRRGQPWQRRPRLRAAPAAPSRHPVGQAAGHRHPDRRRADGDRPRRDGSVVPGTGHRLRPHPAHRGRRGDGVQPNPGLGFEVVRRSGDATKSRPDTCCRAPTRSRCTTRTASRSN